MIPLRLKRRYWELVAMARDRQPGWTPPPIPPDDAGPQAFINTNQIIVARLSGRTPTTVRVKKEPFLIPERDGG